MRLLHLITVHVIAALNAEVASLRKEVATLKAQLQESSAGCDKWEEQIARLEKSCHQVQERSREKIEVRLACQVYTMSAVFVCHVIVRCFCCHGATPFLAEYVLNMLSE